MKKAFCIIILSAVLLCTSACGDGVSYKDIICILQSAYSADISVADENGIYKASVTNDGDVLMISFSEPAALCGIGYGLTDSGCFISYNETSIPVNAAGQNDKISGGVLSWKDLLLPDGEYTVGRASRQASSYILTDGSREYEFDRESGIPLCIKCGDITIIFSNFRKTQ